MISVHFVLCIKFDACGSAGFGGISNLFFSISSSSLWSAEVWKFESVCAGTVKCLAGDLFPEGGFVWLFSLPLSFIKFITLKVSTLILVHDAYFLTSLIPESSTGQKARSSWFKLLNNDTDKFKWINDHLQFLAGFVAQHCTLRSTYTKLYDFHSSSTVSYFLMMQISKSSWN